MGCDDDTPAPDWTKLADAQRQLLTTQSTPDGDLAGRLRQVFSDEDAAHAVEVVRAAGWGPREDPAVLSKLLWHGREIAEMYADVVESRVGRSDNYSRRVVAEIDAYRAERGWNPDGFGGEK